jgi:uncharacterized protein YndB with AHSA1/START domain
MRTDAASLLVPASPEQVFAAMIDESALARWLPPHGMVGKFDNFDARPGGSYRLTLMYDDESAGRGKATANSDIVDVRFVEMVPGVRIVQEVDFVSDDAAYSGTMTMRFELTPAASGTCVTVRAENVPAGISPEDHAAGLESSLANLADYLGR